MTIDIVIRTWFRDFRWLRLCLKSILLHVRGYRHVVVVMPLSSIERLPTTLLSEHPRARLEACPDYEDDYVGQQITKLHADEASDADAILHWDADCIAVADFNICDWFFKNERSVIYRRHWPDRRIVHPWRDSAERFLGLPCRDDFMPMLPILYPRWVYSKIRAFSRQHHGIAIAGYVLSTENRDFSEFNSIGAFARRFHPESFCWRRFDGETAKRWPVYQFWSWEGITPQVRAALPSHLASIA